MLCVCKLFFDGCFKINDNVMSGKMVMCFMGFYRVVVSS